MSGASIIAIFSMSLSQNDPLYILVKSSNRPRVFLPIFGRAIRTISISFEFPNRLAYQSSITENG